MVRRRDGRSGPVAGPPRFRHAPADPGRPAGPLPGPRLGQGRRLPDPQPDAPGPPGTDPAGGGSGRRRAPHPPRRRDDQARRRRSLHEGALLPGCPRRLPAGAGRPLPAAPGHAHGRAEGGAVARHHPQELRLHAPDRRAGPRRPGGHGRRDAVLRALRGPGASPPVRSRGRGGDGPLPDDDLRRGPRHLPPRRRGAGRFAGHEHLRDRAAPAPRPGRGDPRVVHAPGGGRRAASQPPGPGPAGPHRPLHRAVGLGQVDHRQRRARPAARGGIAAGLVARRRPRPQEPLVGAGLLEGAPQPQRAAHRLRRLRDHPARRDRPLRPHRPL